MYFGDIDVADWPLSFAAWAANDLLGYAVGSVRHVTLTLHHHGGLSAVVDKARVIWPATRALRPVDELIRRRMWWLQLTLSATVTVQRDGKEPGEPQRIGEEFVWTDLDIATQMMLDPELIGVGSDRWWQAGTDRLRALFESDEHRLSPGCSVAIRNEVTGTSVEVP
jgi:hypothetical protein